jgi:hypothetical protein
VTPRAVRTAAGRRRSCNRSHEDYGDSAAGGRSVLVFSSSSYSRWHSGQIRVRRSRRSEQAEQTESEEGKPVVAIGPVRARDYEGDEDPGEGGERPAAVQMVVRYGCEALGRGRRDMSASLAPALYALWPASGPSSEPLRSYRCTVHV